MQISRVYLPNVSSNLLVNSQLRPLDLLLGRSRNFSIFQASIVPVASSNLLHKAQISASVRPSESSRIAALKDSVSKFSIPKSAHNLSASCTLTFDALLYANQSRELSVELEQSGRGQINATGIQFRLYQC